MGVRKNLLVTTFELEGRGERRLGSFKSEECDAAVNEDV